MIALPFVDIPIVEVDTPSIEERRRELEIWAEGNRSKIATAFLAYANEGDSIDDYSFQVGFVSNDRLITTVKAIVDVGYLLNLIREQTEFVEVCELMCSHIELYFMKAKKIPIWGVKEFYELKESGRTTRVLTGPHKGGSLKPNKRREVVIDKHGEIVYGPLLD